MLGTVPTFSYVGDLTDCRGQLESSMTTKRWKKNTKWKKNSQNLSKRIALWNSEYVFIYFWGGGRNKLCLYILVLWAVGSFQLLLLSSNLCPLSLSSSQIFLTWRLFLWLPSIKQLTFILFSLNLFSIVTEIVLVYPALDPQGSSLKRLKLWFWSPTG